MNSKEVKVKKVKVEQKRDVNTYTELWHTSYCLLQKGQQEKEMSVYQFRASLIFTAFTLEAYLNHTGSKIIFYWNDIEKSLSPQTKLNIITKHLDITIDYEKRPWQTVTELFRFRNEIAHGKDTEITPDEKNPSLNKCSDKYIDNLQEKLQTLWESYGTENNAIMAINDVEHILEIIQKAGYEADFLKNETPGYSGIKSLSGHCYVKKYPPQK